MKLIIIFLLFSHSALALTTSELLIQKRDNFNFVKQNYSLLKVFLQNDESEKFCINAGAIVNKLYEIYNEDMQLASSLKKYGIEDYDSYAAHISENAASDLFMFSYFEDMCQNGSPSNALSSFENIEINQEYLIMTHTFWMGAYCPQLPKKCEIF